MENLIMIKWGGSLITNKNKPLTPNIGIIKSLVKQIKEIREIKPELKIILGHGSGSFGHSIAAKYQTRDGIKNNVDWIGFSQVWYAVRALNIIVTRALNDLGIPSITFPPSVFIKASGGIGVDYFRFPFDTILSTNILPVVHGDVVFDEDLGGTILSTEDIFLFLAEFYQPEKIYLAGIEKCIWEDFPKNKKPIKKISPKNFLKLQDKIGGSSNVDVTGGMFAKVKLMVDLVTKFPNLKVNIFSGTSPEGLKQEILGQSTGTVIEME